MRDLSPATRTWLWVMVGTLLATGTVAACQRSVEPASVVDRAGMRTPVGGVQVWTDPATGCEYLIETNHGTMTPRLRPTGQPYCPGRN